MATTIAPNCLWFCVLGALLHLITSTGEHVHFNNPHMLNNKAARDAAARDTKDGLSETMSAAAQSRTAARQLEMTFFWRGKGVRIGESIETHARAGGTSRTRRARYAGCLRAAQVQA